MEFQATKERAASERSGEQPRVRVATAAGITDVREAAAAAAEERAAKAKLAQATGDQSIVGIAKASIEDETGADDASALVCGGCAPAGGFSLLDDDDESIPDEEKAPADRLIIPSDVIPINETDETIQIVGTRGEKVTKIDGLEKCTVLKNLILRACLISKIEGVGHMTGLEKLELYDNQIEAITCVSTLHNLRTLDLSFNCIRTMGPVRECPMLEELYIAQNKLRKIEGLESLVHLRVLDLGANRIRMMEGLENNVNLKSLWLGKNKIECIQGIDTLSKLTQLDVQSNRLLSLGGGMNNLPMLKELYLAHNKISSVADLVLPDSTSLDTVDLSGNPITSLEGIERNSKLEECWLSSTALPSFEELAPLGRIATLQCIYLEHSPVAKHPDYKKVLQELVPSLTQLDALLVSSLK